MVKEVNIGDKSLDLGKLQWDIVVVLDNWVSIYVNDQNPNPNDIRHGQYHNTDDTRIQEYTALAAWVSPYLKSICYQSSDALNSAIWPAARLNS